MCLCIALLVGEVSKVYPKLLPSQLLMIFNQNTHTCTCDRNTTKIEKMEDIFIDTFSYVTHKCSQKLKKIITEIYNGKLYIFTPFGTH